MNSQRLKLDEVYGLWYTSFWKTSIGYTIIIISAILVLFFLIWLIKKFVFAQKKLTYSDIARSKLNKLLSLKADNQHEYKEIYSALTNILKNYIQSNYRYIQGNYRIIKQGITDMEMVEELNTAISDEKLSLIIKNIVEHAQAVKFAHQDIIKQQAQDDIVNALLFIDQTSIKNK